MEATGFEGKVVRLSPGLHRHDVDTVTVKLKSWTCPDSLFLGKTYGTYFNKKDTLFSGYLIHGDREGTWRYYQAHESPYKIFEGQYSKNKRNGVFKKYYQLTNQLEYEESYKDNLPHGRFKWWFSNGQIESIKYFDYGTPVGVWEFYDSKGALLKKLDYGNTQSSR